MKEFVSYAGRIDLGSPIVTLRGNIIYYGFFFFQALISFILLIKIFFKKNKYIIDETSFTFFLYLCLFLGSLSLFVLGSLIFPDRFLPFGLMLGLIPLITLFFSLEKTAYKRIFLIFVISFLIFNIYNIDPNYYTGKAALDGGVTEQEYAIAQTVNAPKSYYGYISVSDAIYDIQGINFTHGAIKDPITTIDFFNTSNFAIINEGMQMRNLENTKLKLPKTYNKIITILSYKNYIDINKISDLGDIFIIEWKNL